MKRVLATTSIAGLLGFGAVVAAPMSSAGQQQTAAPTVAAAPAADTADTKAADAVICRGSVGARTLDSIYVPAGRSCWLNGTYLKGSIKIYGKGNLYASKIRLLGSIQSDSYSRVRVWDSAIGGSVQLKGTGISDVRRTPISGSIQTEGHSTALNHSNRIRGSIQLIKGGAIDTRSNTVTGDVQIFENRYGSKPIYGNIIYGNLQCKENAPAPYGARNQVHGNKEDQCRRV